MKSLIQNLTDQFQLWLGTATPITLADVTTLLQKSRDETLQAVEPVTIRIEGEPKDVSVVIQMLKEILPVTEQKVNTAILPGGRIRREINLIDQTTSNPAARPGNLDPRKADTPLPRRSTPSPLGQDKLIFEALPMIARGLLQFPMDADGRRIFSSVIYPPLFVDGIAKLSTYYLTRGTSLNNALKYWHLLSRPLNEWPHMPEQLRAPQSLIDHEGRTTSLTDYLANQ